MTGVGIHPLPASPGREANRGALVARAFEEAGGLLPSLPVWAWWAVGGAGDWTWLAGLSALAALAGLMTLRLPRTAPGGSAALALTALAGLALLSLLSTTWAPDRGAALLEAERAALFALSFAMPLLWPPSLRFLERAVAALAALAAAAAVTALATALDPDGRLVGPLGYPNAIAALLAGAGLALTALWGAEAGAGRRAAAWAGGGALIGVAVLAQSRGMMLAVPATAAIALVLVPRRLPLLFAYAAIAAGLLAIADPLLDVRDAATDPARRSALPIALAALAGLAIVLAGLAAMTRGLGGPAPAVAARRTKPRRPRRAIVAAVAALGLLPFAPSIVGWGETRWEDFKRPDYDRVGVADDRFEAGLGSNRADYWRVSVAAASESPLQGVGAGNFAGEYRRAGDTRSTPERAHSIWFSALGELGLPGLCLLACFVSAAALAARVALRRAAPRERVVRVAALLPALYLLVHASGDWIASFPVLTAPALGLLAGAIAAPSPGAPAAPPPVPRRGGWPAVAALILAVSALPPAVADRMAEVGWRNALGDPAAGLADLRLAASLNPLSAEPETAIGTICAIDGRSGCARAGFTEAVSRDPSAWFAQLQLGLLARAEGRRAEAELRLGLARSLAPRDPLTRRIAASPYAAARRLLARRGALSSPAGTPPADRSRPRRYDGGPSDDRR